MGKNLIRKANTIQESQTDQQNTQINLASEKNENEMQNHRDP